MIKYLERRETDNTIACDSKVGFEERKISEGEQYESIIALSIKAP